VDDAAIVRERLVTMLSELKKVEAVDQASGPLQAVDAVGKLKSDVVILHIRMPAGSGPDLMRNIKADPDIPCPTFLILTNYPYLEYRRACLEPGAAFFFDKSTEFEKVAEALRTISATS